VASLENLRVRLHGLKMTRQKRAAVMPLVQHAGPTCSEEGCIRHAEEAEGRSQVQFYEIERSHFSLSMVNATGRDDESCFLTSDQDLWRSVCI
jgi:hypothetical protein